MGLRFRTVSSASSLGCVTNTTNHMEEPLMNTNHIVLTGRLTRDPELRALPSGSSVCELRVAVDGMGRGREVGYINVSVFGNGGEAAAKHLAKGWLVAVDGRLEYGEWEAEGGRRHDYTLVGNVEFLAAPRSPGDQDAAAQAAQAQAA
jgi:single-strand DNA-binding protein